MPEYNPAVYYYPAGTIVQWNGWLYQAAHGGAAQNEPSLNYTLTEGDLSKPWLRIGSAGGSDAYRSFSNTLRVGEKEIVVKKSFSSHVHKYSVCLGANGDYSLSDESTDLYFNETTQDKTLRWLVEVDAGTTDTFILTDALPEQVQLVGLYVASAQRMQWELTPYQSDVDFTSDGSAFTDSVQGYTVTGSYDADGDNEVNLSITPAAGGKFRVLFVCELKENYLPQNGQRFIYSLGNSAEVQVNDEIFGEAENTINLTVEERKTVTEKTGTRNYKKNPDGSLMLDNSGNPIWDNTITYTVDINPNAENLVINPLLDPNDTLFIKDTLSYVCRDEIGTGSATLGLGSISLIDANTNEPVSVEWTARTTVLNNIRTSTIEGRVPDGRHLILSYTYSIWSTMQSGISLHNTVTIEGSAFQPGEFDEIHGKEDFQTHAGSDYPEYHIIKVAKVGREPLAGARFTAYAWVYDVVSGGYNWVAVDKTYVSDGNGVIKISAFDKADSSPQNNVYSVNTAYCVMETAAPPGYIIDPNNIPTYYFWVSANNSTAPANAPADFMAYALDLTFSSGQEYVENEMGNDYTLPETGSPGALLCTAGGAVLMAFALIYGYTRKRKRERRLIVPP